MKSGRQRRILELIRTECIETQDELLRRLSDCGYNVTQATISRDIKALRLVKIPDNGKSRYLESGGESSVNSLKFMNMFADNVTSISRGQNIVCIKCMNGMAQAVCASLDTQHWDTIVGTLAGEDTIFVLCRSDKDAQKLSEELNRLLVR